MNTNASVLKPINNMNLVNEFMVIKLNKLLPRFEVGSAQKSVTFGKFKNEDIEIPTNHVEIAKIINQINKWEKLVNKTTKKMEKYIEGILQLSLGGVTNE